VNKEPSRLALWLLSHQSRLSWVLLELMRGLSWKLAVRNAWFQVCHYDDIDAWRAQTVPDRSPGSGETDG
jgi:hypothetical protein